jgi:hypothetical protein
MVGVARAVALLLGGRSEDRKYINTDIFIYP